MDDPDQEFVVYLISETLYAQGVDDEYRDEIALNIYEKITSTGGVVSRSKYHEIMMKNMEYANKAIDLAFRLVEVKDALRSLLESDPVRYKRLEIVLEMLSKKTDEDLPLEGAPDEAAQG